MFLGKWMLIYDLYASLRNIYKMRQLYCKTWDSKICVVIWSGRGTNLSKFEHMDKALSTGGRTRTTSWVGAWGLKRVSVCSCSFPGYLGSLTRSSPWQHTGTLALGWAGGRPWPCSLCTPGDEDTSSQPAHTQPYPTSQHLSLAQSRPSTLTLVSSGSVLRANMLNIFMLWFNRNWRSVKLENSQQTSFSLCSRGHQYSNINLIKTILWVRRCHDNSIFWLPYST